MFSERSNHKQNEIPQAKRKDDDLPSKRMKIEDAILIDSSDDEADFSRSTKEPSKKRQKIIDLTSSKIIEIDWVDENNEIVSSRIQESIEVDESEPDREKNESSEENSNAEPNSRKQGINGSTIQQKSYLLTREEKEKRFIWSNLPQEAKAFLVAQNNFSIDSFDAMTFQEIKHSPLISSLMLENGILSRNHAENKLSFWKKKIEENREKFNTSYPPSKSFTRPQSKNNQIPVKTSDRHKKSKSIIMNLWNSHLSAEEKEENSRIDSDAESDPLENTKTKIVRGALFPRKFLSQKLTKLIPEKDCIFLEINNVKTIEDFQLVDKEVSSPLVEAWLESFNLKGEMASKSCSSMLKYWESQVLGSYKTWIGEENNANGGVGHDDIARCSKHSHEIVESHDKIDISDSESSDEIYVMNEVKHLCYTTIDKVTGLPIKFITVYDNDENLYDFRIDIRESMIPNSGWGGFLTFRGARRLNSKGRRMSNLLFDSLIYCNSITREPLDAKMSDGTIKTVTIAGEQIHGDNINDYWLPHKLPTDGAILPNGKRIKVKMKQFDFFNYDDIVQREGGIGFFDVHKESDYILEKTAMFSSYNEGCGLIDIGLYGPFRDKDRKTEHDFDLKDFIFCHEPSSWNFGVEPKLHGFTQIIDVTDDTTGEPHDQAKENVCMYVNEAGSSGKYTQNVLPKELGQNVHYYLQLKKPMKRGQTVELLVDYSEDYEKTRERKGYGLANLRGEILGDEDPATRLDRNLFERKEIAKYVNEMQENEVSRSLYFMTSTISDPVMKSLQKYLNERPYDPSLIPHPRLWLAKKRMQWLGDRMRRHVQQLLANSLSEDQSVLKNLLKILKTKRLHKFEALPSGCESLEYSKSCSLGRVFQREVFEELLFDSKVFVMRPFDHSLWCQFSQNLMRRIGCRIVDWKISSHETRNKQDLVNTLFSEALKAKRQIEKVSFINSENLRQYCFKPTLLGRDSVDASVDNIKRAASTDKDFGKVNIFHVPAHVAVAYRRTKGNENFSKTVNRLCKSSLFLVGKTSKGRSNFVAIEELGLEKNEDLKIPLDINWYVLWQVVLVVHGLAFRCTDWKPPKGRGTEKIYSLEKLCSVLALDFNDAKQMLTTAREACSSYDRIQQDAENSRSCKQIKKKKKRDKKHARSIARKKTNRPPPLQKNKLFYDIVWKNCITLGWRIETGNRPNDYYFLPPGVYRKDPERKFKNRRDYFDSIKQVLEFLPSDPYWKTQKSIQDALSLLRDATNYIMNEKKNISRDTKTEWLLERIKEKREKEKI